MQASWLLGVPLGLVDIVRASSPQLALGEEKTRPPPPKKIEARIFKKKDLKKNVLKDIFSFIT